MVLIIVQLSSISNGALPDQEQFLHAMLVDSDQTLVSSLIELSTSLDTCKRKQMHKQLHPQHHTSVNKHLAVRWSLTVVAAHLLLDGGLIAVSFKPMQCTAACSSGLAEMQSMSVKCMNHALMHLSP